MSTSKERVFVVGASGTVGSDVVRGLIKKGVDTTAYVRDESKGKSLFKDELATGHLIIVVGTYTTTDVFTKAIKGHTRLFLLTVADTKRPTSMSEIKGTLGKIAFESGVRQIVDLSSFTVRSFGRQGFLGYSHTTAEEKLWTLADEKTDQRSLVILRPGVFMTNQLEYDIHSVKHMNKLLSVALPTSTEAWIDVKDIADCAVVVLTEPVEKHDRCVYEMAGESLNHEQRAAIFSRVLGRSITYEQQSVEDLYKMIMSYGLSHALAYDIISLYSETNIGHATPQVSVLLNRPLRTMEQWLEENRNAFEI